MKKIILFLLMVLLLAVVVEAGPRVQTFWNPFTGRLDYILDTNQSATAISNGSSYSGVNFFADGYYFGNNSLPITCNTFQVARWNSTTGVWQCNDAIDFTNLTKNSFIDGPVVGLLQTGPTGVELPHLIIQSGGPEQASVLVRSLMIVNENDTFLNSDNRTSCRRYMEDIAGDILQIDCNTTTTGADLIVGDDLQVIGDIWIKDTEAEWHFLTRTMQLLDELFDDILFNRVNTTLEGTSFEINDTTGQNLVVNIDTLETRFTTDSDDVTITLGTDLNPTMNYLYYENSVNPVLVRSGINPDSVSGLEHAEVGRVLAGSNGNVYGYLGGSAHNHEFIDGVYHRLFDQGVLYVSGFFPASSTSSLNISDGEMTVMIDKLNLENNLTYESSGFFYTVNNGSFYQSSTLDVFTEYADGNSISNNKYYNVILGIIPNATSTMRMMAIVQDKPTSEYNTLILAEADSFGATNIFPADEFLKKVFIPVARVVFKKGTDSFQTLGNGANHFDIRGQTGISAGSPPSPSITDHDQLNNLNWASAGHIMDADFDMNSNNITGANIINAVSMNATNISAGFHCFNPPTCTHFMNATCHVWSNGASECEV